MDESKSYGCYASIPNRKSKKRKRADAFDLIDSEPWYIDYREICYELESKLMNLNKSLHHQLVLEVVRFIRCYEYSPERIPTIALFTGINLSDHDLIFSMIRSRIRKKCKIPCRIVHLNAAKATNLKSLITDTVYNFLNYNDKDNSYISLTEEDTCKPIKKSKCTLPYLVDWYSNNFGDENEYSRNMYLIIVVPNIANFSGRILDEFFRILSLFRDRLPFVFIFDIPTTLNIIHKTFSCDVLSKLAIHLFQAQPSTLFLDKVLEKIFLTPDCVFQLGGNTFKMLCDLFTTYNFSIKEFIKGIKLCLMEHFYRMNFNIVCCGSENYGKKIDALDEDEINRLLELPSMKRYNNQNVLTASSPNIKRDLKKLRTDLGRNLVRFHLAIRCIHVLLKYVPENSLYQSLRDIYIQAMDANTVVGWLKKRFVFLRHLSKESLLEALGGISDLLHEYSDDKLVSHILRELKKNIETIEDSAIRVVKKSPRSPDKSPVKIEKASTRADLRQTLKSNLLKEKTLSEFDVAKDKILNFLLDDFFKDTLKSIDKIPLRELFFFEDDGIVQRLLDGVPRTAIDYALETPIYYLECDCCKQTLPDDIVKTMPDISIVYKLHTECGNQINLYDWFQQFRVKVDKEDFTDEEIDPEIYGRFVQAARELHYLGFITRPKRKISTNAEYVSKLTF